MCRRLILNPALAIGGDICRQQLDMGGWLKQGSGEIRIGRAEGLKGDSCGKEHGGQYRTLGLKRRQKSQEEEQSLQGGEGDGKGENCWLV